MALLRITEHDFAYCCRHAKVRGDYLSVSLLIAPGAIAVLLTQRFSNALFIAVALSALVSTTGVYLSYFIDSAPAPTVVLLFALIFIVIFIYSSFKYNEKYL